MAFKIGTFSLLAITAITLTAITSATTAVAEFRIALVDINRVLNESKEAQTKRKELDEMTLKAKKKLEDKRVALKASEDKLKASNAKEDSKEVEAFRAEARNFSRMIKDSEEEIKREFLKTNKVLTEKALKLVSDYAKRNDYDLVLDRGEAGRSPVLYGVESADISDAIVKDING